MLVCLALVAPWQWVVTRAVVGVLLVVGGSTFIARFYRRRSLEIEGSAGAAIRAEEPAEDTFDLAPAQARFAKALLRLALILVPEYFVVVLLVAGFGGWLSPLNGSAHEPVATAAAIVLGTLLVIPTAGEIPLPQGLSSAGFSLGVVGALLVTLPAVSLPSLVMVGRALTWRVTAAAAGAVAIGGAVAALLLTGLS